MKPMEAHYCSRFSRLKSLSLVVAVSVALVAVYATGGYHNDNVALRAEVAAMKARGCPARLQGKALAGNTYQERDLMRPKYSTLTCLYRAGVTS